MVKQGFQEKEFYQLAENYIESGFKDFPVGATWAGVHQYDDQMREVSEGRVKRLKEKAEETLRAVEAFSGPAFGLEARIDWELFRTGLRGEIRDWKEIKSWQKDPGGYFREAIYSLYFLVIHHPEDLKPVAASMLARLKKIPSFLKQAQSVVAETPLIWVKIGLDELQGGRIFFQTVAKQLATQVPKLKKEVQRASGEVSLALDDQEKFLQGLKKKFRGEFSVGSRLLTQIVKESHFLPYSLSEIEAIGWEQVKSTQKLLVDQGRKISKDQSWQEILADFRKHHRLGDKNLVETYRRETARIKKHLVDNQVVSFPQDEILEIVSTPKFMRSTTPTAAYHSPGPLEKDQRGIFYVSDPQPGLSLKEKDQVLQQHAGLTLTCTHEAYPGHHLQLVVSNRGSGLVRKLSHRTIFVEGWALYTEELVEEIGLVKDPVLRLQRLADQLWRAYRIVIDVGLQTRKMTVAEAQRLLVDNLGFSSQRAEGEINWYSQRPGYPMGYLLGKLEILKLRKRFKKYSLREFHDRLLGCGSIPPALSQEGLKEREEK